MVEIVLGPPGTGKTTRLLSLVDEELSRGTAPDRIGYVSFTKRAADEAVSRACAQFELKPADLPFFRTLHALCFRQLSLKRGEVLEGDRLDGFALYAGIRVTGKFSDDGTLSGYAPGDRILHMINLARIRRMELRALYDQDDDSLPWYEVDRVARAYVAYKKENSLLDYTDMLEEFVRSKLRINLEVLFVDEAQDLSSIQWAVVQLLSMGCRRVVIAGDDDQAIYRWAGADVDHLIEMLGDVTVLNQSYRVPKSVQELANNIISRIQHRRVKWWQARDEEGVVAKARDFRTVDVSEGSVMVLARNTYLLEQVRQTLRREGIIYEQNGWSSVKGAVLSAITSWERLRAGETITTHEAREVYKQMSAGVGVERGFKTLPGFTDDQPLSLVDLRQRGGLLREDIWHEALDRLPPSEMSYLLAARKRGEKLKGRPRVRLSTIHGSKGGEADHVVLLRDMAPRTFQEMCVLPDDEARVWYVAATRARQRLTIVDAHTSLACPWV